MRKTQGNGPNHYKNWRCLYGLLVLALVLYACGDNGDNGTEDAASPDGDETVTLSFASPNTEDGTHGRSLQHWADAVEEVTDGTVLIDIHPLGSLLAGTDIMPGVADGRADLGLVYSNYHDTELALWNVLGIPFLTDNGVAVGEAFAALYEESEVFQQEFQESFAGAVEPLWFIIIGAAPLGTAEPAESPEDLAGNRLRAYGELGTAAAEAGADGVFAELPEVYESLQRGVLDGWLGIELPSAVALDLHDVTPHLAHTGIGQYANGVVVANPDAWEALSENQRDAIASLTEDYPATLTDMIVELEDEACDTLIEEGGTATIWDEQTQDEWRDSVQDDIIDNVKQGALNQGISEEEFDEFLSRYEELLDQYEQEHEYVDGLRRCAER